MSTSCMSTNLPTTPQRSGNTTPLPVNSSSSAKPSTSNGRQYQSSPKDGQNEALNRLATVSETAGLVATASLGSTASSSPSLENYQASRASSTCLFDDRLKVPTSKLLPHPTAEKVCNASLPTSPLTLTASSCPSTTLRNHASPPPSHHSSGPLFSSHPDLKANQVLSAPISPFAPGPQPLEISQSLGDLRSIYSAEKCRRRSLDKCSQHLSHSDLSVKPVDRSSVGLPIVEEIDTEAQGHLSKSKPTAFENREGATTEHFLNREEFSSLFADPTDLDLFPPVFEKTSNEQGEQKPSSEPIIDCKKVLDSNRLGAKVNDFQVSLLKLLQSRFDTVSSSVKALSRNPDLGIDNMVDLVVAKNKATQDFHRYFSEYLGSRLLSSFKTQETFSQEDFTRTLAQTYVQAQKDIKRSDLLHLSFETAVQKLHLDLEKNSSYSNSTVASWHAGYILKEGKDCFIEVTKAALDGSSLLQEDDSYLASLPLDIKRKFPSYHSWCIPPNAKVEPPHHTYQTCLRLFVYLVSNQICVDFSATQQAELYKMFVDRMNAN